jgi:hypothetical protein
MSGDTHPQFACVVGTLDDLLTEAVGARVRWRLVVVDDVSVLNGRRGITELQGPEYKVVVAKLYSRHEPGVELHPRHWAIYHELAAHVFPHATNQGWNRGHDPKFEPQERLWFVRIIESCEALSMI